MTFTREITEISKENKNHSIDYKFQRNDQTTEKNKMHIEKKNEIQLSRSLYHFLLGIKEPNELITIGRIVSVSFKQK
jgi:hypothetical protein